MNSDCELEGGYAEFEPVELEGRYRLIERLGAGASGVVYKGEDLELGNRLCAVKVLYPHLVQSEESVLQFKREVLITQRLSHPAIIQTYSFFESSEHDAILVMEYVSGVTLREFLLTHSGGLPTELVLDLLHSILCGLEYAHSLGVVHRDIKPDNIMLTHENEAKIADFGLAQSAMVSGATGQHGEAVGTPYYMSPEAFRGDYCDASTDMYSLGIMGYEILCGELPFRCPSLFLLAEAHAHAPMPSCRALCADTPEWLAELLQRCCEKQAKLRPTAAEFLEVIEKHVSYDSRSKSSLRSIRLSPQQLQVLELESLQDPLIPRSRPILLFFSLLVMLLVIALFSGRVFRGITWHITAAIAYTEKVTGTRLPWLYTVIDIKEDIYDPETRLAPNRSTLWAALVGGIDPNEVASDGLTSLARVSSFSANSRFKHNSILYLLEYGADVNKADRFGRTPIWFAALSGDSWAVETLIAAGADIHVATVEGKTPLHAAARRADRTQSFIFLRGGASPLAEDSQGLTPLHEVTSRCDVPLLKTYLRNPHVSAFDGDREALFTSLFERKGFCRVDSSVIEEMRVVLRKGLRLPEREPTQ